MRPLVITAGPFAAADADGIAQAQKPAATFTLNGALVSGGIAQLGAMRRVLFTTVADETGVTFTVTGTNRAGDVLSEAVAGVNNTTTYTALDFYTVTGVTASATPTGNVTVGTNGVGGSPWARLDEWALPNASVQTVVSGTINYTVQYSNDDPNSATDPVLPAAMTWSTFTTAGAVTTVTNTAYAPLWVRVLVNSNTNPAYVRATVTQTGVVPF
jgi:hypothetical protein